MPSLSPEHADMDSRRKRVRNGTGLHDDDASIPNDDDPTGETKRIRIGLGSSDDGSFVLENYDPDIVFRSRLSREKISYREYDIPLDGKSGPYVFEFALQDKLAMERLEVGAVLQKLIDSHHQRICLVKPSGFDLRYRKNYDFRDWNWLFGFFHQNLRWVPPLEIVLDGITIDVEMLTFLLVDRSIHGNRIFNRIYLRNVCIVGGMSARKSYGKGVSGFTIESSVFVHIVDLDVKSPQSEQEPTCAQQIYEHIRKEFTKPMRQKRQIAFVKMMERDPACVVSMYDQCAK